MASDGVRVRFLLPFEGRAPGSQVVVSGETTDGLRLLQIEDEPPTCRLPMGSYVAAIRRDELWGPSASFVVAGDPLDVELAPLAPFALTFQVLDSSDGTALSGARVEANRVNVPREWSLEGPASTASDSTGTARLEGLCAGDWELSVALEGFVPANVTMELPGAWGRSVDETGVVDLQWFRLAPERPVTFELVGVEDWQDVTGFAVAHTHDGDRVPFNADRRATIVLGSYSEPLYVKLWYPDSRESVFYMDGGLPDHGEVHQIEVGGPRELEVDLQLLPEVAGLIGSSETWLRVAFRTNEGDARSVGLPVDGSGTYAFAGVQAASAVASFLVVDGEDRSEWATRAVTLAPEGRTACTLVVEHPPLGIRIVDEAGVPLPGFQYEIYRVPATSSWVIGGETDESGLCLAPRVADGRFALFGFTPDDSTIVIETPLDLAAAEDRIEVVVGSTESTFIEASVSGQPVAGVVFRTLGAQTRIPYLYDVTDEAGRTPAHAISVTSSAVAILESDSLWWPHRERPLRPGRNAVTLYETGVLTTTSAADLTNVRSAQFGRSLAEWVGAGLVRELPKEGSRRSFRVPVGTYEVRTSPDRVVDVEVTAEARVASGL